MAIITLLNHLSLEDKETLDSMRHMVIDLDDNLIDKIIRLHDENVRLESIALIDNLTGLFNNRFFLNNLETEMARTMRTGLTCSLMIIDLDNFKLVNDTSGHLEGNKFLIEVGRILRDNVRPTDMVCRYGGDEFTIIMPATELFDAILVADRLKSAVQNIPTARQLAITSSIGIAEHKPSSSYNVDELIHAADSALYDAKKSGKNQVSFAGRQEGVKPHLEPVTVKEKEALSKDYNMTEKKGD